VPLSPDLIDIVFASGPEDLNRQLVERSKSPQLVVVSEFEPAHGRWIPWHVLRSESDNLASIRAAIGNRRIGRAAMILSPLVPFAKMRNVASSLAEKLITYDQDLRPISYAGYSLGQALATMTSPRARKWLYRLVHPGDAEIPVRARLAKARGKRARSVAPEKPVPPGPTSPGVTVVIPSRDGKDLLAALLPALVPQVLHGEIIVSDNGSTDETLEWLKKNWPAVQVIESARPLSFARAVNAGVEAAHFHRLLMLNNDMIVEPGFVDALNTAFDQVPDLFCSTAQIFFPPDIRREETGKAVWRRENPLDFPVRCDDPLPGEDLTWVLYGSGGCSLFDTGKLRALGGVSEVYDPAYVEDMDFGYRAWKRGWPSVFCAGAKVEHRHRATTSRFYSARQLDVFVEVNYLRFLIHAIGSPILFQELWRDAIRRLQLKEALDVLREVPKIGPLPPPATGLLSEPQILALGNGDLAVFPGLAEKTTPIVVIASPYLPFPLSHGGAVRMYNLMRGTAPVLIAFCDELATPPSELLGICREVILVRRHGSHYRRDTARPDMVEEFDSESFRACLKQTIRRWNPDIVQLEFTWMAQYAGDCAPAKTILVEHDITFELQEQMLATTPGSWELKQQLQKWREFETAAWKQVDCVVTMSAKDQAVVTGAVCLPNGVDTSRFVPSAAEPEPRRLLFIGSFAHVPNVRALEFFVNDVWPLLGPGYVLHIIGGYHPERHPINADLTRSGIELEGFVSDVRAAYSRAEMVIAPLTASAGTNIKVLEAMAMGKLVVSTPAGINGLDLKPDSDLIVVTSAAEMAERIRTADPKAFERQARETALLYDWSRIAREQLALYGKLIGEQ